MDDERDRHGPPVRHAGGAGGGTRLDPRRRVGACRGRRETLTRNDDSGSDKNNESGNDSDSGNANALIKK